MAEWIEDPQGRPEVEKVTKELKLPVWKANHKGKFRDFWNELWDKIEDNFLKLKKDTGDKSKELENRLASAVGKDDGDFPITNAVVGNVYYSALTKKYYKCKVGGPAPMPNGNFIDMSILENLNRLENLVTSYNLKGWNIIEFPSKKVILSLRKNVDYNENPYKFNLPLKIANGVILASSEDIDNQFVFTSTISNDEIIIKRWPNIIGHGHSVVDILIIGDKLS